MLEKAGRACREAMRQGKMHRYWLPMALRFRGMLEWRQGNARAAERSWRNSLATAEELGARHEHALTSLEMGRCLRRLELVRQAAETFAEVGARPDLVEARRYLDETGYSGST